MSAFLSETEITKFKDFAEELAALAGETVRQHLGALAVEVKADGSPVTAIDLAVERRLRERIEQRYPAHGILGEEFGSSQAEAELVWVLDPIDGTRQFAAGLMNYGTLIALCQAGRPVLGIICQPRLDEVFLGITAAPGAGAWRDGVAIRCNETGRLGDAVACLGDPDSYKGGTAGGFDAIRRASGWNVFDGSCMGFSALAAGRLDIALCGPNLDPYDICALVPVVEGAGGVISGWRGEALTLASEGCIVASCSERLHASVIELLEPVVAQMP